ncbi:unnamed protein product [Clonostachys byssicola]|uniref:PNPLA domain-containing protein n=1 Tax=Clonostachys byssicola TaxID=160290 RepID=A0A9N9YB53_9HYPO|nr:unnamed protein product [Clonostachys byssicola]
MSARLRTSLWTWLTEAADGGGVRGLASLLILKRVLYLINPDSPPKACEIFDFIAGTSTGGLIAIMLGRLVWNTFLHIRWDVEQFGV